jgi:hypothetical protein
MGKTVRRSLLFLLFLSSPLHAATGTITIQPDAAAGEDLWIGTVNPLSGNGEADTLFVGTGDSQLRQVEPDHLPEPDITAEEYDWRTLLRFSLPALPEGASILSANLSLYLRQFWPLVAPFNDPLTITAHGIEASWMEGTSAMFSGANWFQREPGFFWATYGGDYGGQVAEAFLTEGQGEEWIDWNVTAGRRSLDGRLPFERLHRSLLPPEARNRL